MNIHDDDSLAIIFFYETTFIDRMHYWHCNAIAFRQRFLTTNLVI